jgi:Zn-dependent alcohol dehydrogenase
VSAASTVAVMFVMVPIVLGDVGAGVVEAVGPGLIVL